MTGWVACCSGADVEVVLQVGADPGGIVHHRDAVLAQRIRQTDADSISTCGELIAPPLTSPSRAAGWLVESLPRIA